MNNALLTSKTGLWETPQEFFDKLNREFDFTLDACATPENTKCINFYSPEQDGLCMPWNGRVWCNPPYGRQVGQWVKKAYMSAQIRFVRGSRNSAPFPSMVCVFRGGTR